jgi:prophage regulatory protein
MSNSNPHTTSSERLISAHEVMNRVPFSRTTLDRLVKSNQFPKPIKLSEGRKVWVESQINSYIEKKIEESSDAKTDKGAENDNS